MQIQTDLLPVIQAKSGEEVNAVKTYLEAQTVITQSALNSCFKALTTHYITQIDLGKSILNREITGSIQTVCDAAWMLIGIYSPSVFVEKGYLKDNFPNITELVLDNADNLAEITALFSEVQTLKINELNRKEIATISTKCTKLISLECDNANITQDDVKELIIKHSTIKKITLKNCIAIDVDYKATLAGREITISQTVPKGYTVDSNGKIWKSSHFPGDSKKCN